MLPSSSFRPTTSSNNATASSSNTSDMTHNTSNQHAITQDSANRAIVVLLGQTGSGKSTFIRSLYPKYDGVHEGLFARSTDVREIVVPVDDRKIILVDTPGLDNGDRDNQSDDDILKAIRDWRLTRYKEHQHFGVLYFQKMNSQAYLPKEHCNKLIREVCGRSYPQNVMLVTTMWDVTNPGSAEGNEKKLQKRFIPGSPMSMRCIYTEANGYQNAQDIISRLMNRPYQPRNGSKVGRFFKRFLRQGP